MTSDSPSPRRRVPAFAPVPLRYRRDGWTPGRQADFLGHLSETWSVSAAARHVGRTRESAYRLRTKPGAASFAAAWDAILAHRPAPRKSTASLDFHRAFYGTLKPVMRAGRHVATLHSSSEDALLQLYRRELAARRLHRSLGERSQVKESDPP
ncbi:MAG: hypothetical protein M3Q15_05935 [Pseudomonadota bacterium]|nr:hypothetical protein [Pseudomonadota bacterium]